MDPGLISNFRIKIEHLATHQSVSFKGWVTDFSDDFSSNWNTTEVYGRMDPLATFQGTTRTINLSFDVVAGSRTEAIRNDENINKLIQFLYPVYDQGSSGEGVSCTRPKDQSIVAAAPLLRMSYANLVQNNVDQQGLVGYLAGINYSPNLEAGQFLPTSTQTASPGREIVYQQLSINLSFTVLHTHLMGWVQGEGNTFYFGANPGETGDTKYLSNFPHGGTTGEVEDTSEARPEGDPSDAGGNDPMLASEAETDATAQGAEADVQEANNSQITGEC